MAAPSPHSLRMLAVLIVLFALTLSACGQESAATTSTDTAVLTTPTTVAGISSTTQGPPTTTAALTTTEAPTAQTPGTQAPPATDTASTAQAAPTTTKVTAPTEAAPTSEAGPATEAPAVAAEEALGDFETEKEFLEALIADLRDQFLPLTYEWFGTPEEARENHQALADLGIRWAEATAPTDRAQAALAQWRICVDAFAEAWDSLGQGDTTASSIFTSDASMELGYDLASAMKPLADDLGIDLVDVFTAE